MIFYHELQKRMQKYNLFNSKFTRIKISVLVEHIRIFADEEYNDTYVFIELTMATQYNI